MSMKHLQRVPVQLQTETPSVNGPLEVRISQWSWFILSIPKMFFHEAKKFLSIKILLEYNLLYLK